LRYLCAYRFLEKRKEEEYIVTYTDKHLTLKGVAPLFVTVEDSVNYEAVASGKMLAQAALSCTNAPVAAFEQGCAVMYFLLTVQM
jgi:hypothetical protein